MTKHTIALTGATGIVGTRIIQQLLGSNYLIQAIMRSQPPTGHPAWQPQVLKTTMDLLTMSEQLLFDWMNTTRPAALIHCAAMTGMESCEIHVEDAYNLNTHVTRKLARVCARHHVHFIMLSTDYVFNGMYPPGQLYRETDSVQPLNHYGNSKLQAEIAVQEECSDQALWTICRTAMVYGSTHWTRTDFPTWIRTMLNQGKRIRVANDQINSPTYSEDLARMLIEVVKQQFKGIYHTTGSTPINRYHLACTVARHCNLDESLIESVPTSAMGEVIQRPLNVGLCIDKISHDLGIRPLALDEGLAVNWEI